MLKGLLTLAATGLIATAGVAHERGAPIRGISWAVTDLGQGIVMLKGKNGNPGANLALLTGDDGVVLIDDGLGEVVQMTIETVEELAGAKVDFIVNTHAHGDHTGGNPGFAAQGALIIAHDAAREAMVADESVLEIAFPTLTFNDEATIHLNGQTINVSYAPDAHTNSDVIVHFVEANVIHAGDLYFNDIYPFIDLDNGGTVAGFIAGQQMIIDMADDDTKIIAGHGPLGDKAQLQNALDRLVDANAKVKALADQGMSLSEVMAANPLSDFEDLSWFHISTTRMVDILYRSATSN